MKGGHRGPSCSLVRICGLQASGFELKQLLHHWQDLRHRGFFLGNHKLFMVKAHGNGGLPIEGPNLDPQTSVILTIGITKQTRKFQKSCMFDVMAAPRLLGCFPATASTFLSVKEVISSVQ